MMVQFSRGDAWSNKILHPLCPRLNQRINLEIQLSPGSQLLVSVKCLLLGPFKITLWGQQDVLAGKGLASSLNI